MSPMKNLRRYSPEWRDQAVRMVREHETAYLTPRAAISKVARTLGCSTESLRTWMRKAEQETRLVRLTADERRRLKELERENRELKMSNDLLRRAADSFARAAFDRARWGP
jgi:transposase